MGEIQEDNLRIIQVLDMVCDQMSSTCSQEREIFFANIKDIEYSSALVEKAKANHIRITCVSTSPFNVNMQRMASATGGKYTVISTFKSQNILTELSYAIDAMIPEGSGNLLEDTDGDGLPDIYEERGIRISNGQIVHLNPNLVDSDHDGISDFIEVGGLPQKETLLIDGETIETMVSRGGIYDTLSPDFIYVDGRVNADGSVIDEKMDYVAYSYHFYEETYLNDHTVSLFNRRKIVKGVSGIHDCFKDQWVCPYELFGEEIDQGIYTGITIKKYAEINNLFLGIIFGCSGDINAAKLFYRYITAAGGRDVGCKEDATREYLDVEYMFKPTNYSVYPQNTIISYYIEHINDVQVAAESVLNQYNDEMYISLSSNAAWKGSEYLEYGELNFEDILQVMEFPSEFGIFNSAEASITIHCTYNAETTEYDMEYIYYIVDFYDYEKLELLCEQDALGLAKTYELFGCLSASHRWKKGNLIGNLYGSRGI